MARDLQKRRRKQANRAATLLPPGTHISGVFLGRAQARWSGTAGVLTVLIVAIIVVGLLFGQVVIPGFIFIGALVNAIRPFRTIVLADQGVASLRRSFWTGRPQAVIAYESLLAVNGVLSGSTNKVAIGPDLLTLSRREVNGLAALAPRPFGQPGI